MVRVAVLGAGRIGQIHARNVAAHPKARLVAVTDVSAEAAQSLARATGAAVQASSNEIMADAAIDAVLICSPTDTHADLIELAAKAGKAVFCEKPVDLSAARVKQCLDVVAKTGARLMIGFNRRFDPNFRALKQRLDAGEIGAPEIVTIISKDPSPPPVSYIARSGGLFRDMMIHDLDLARFLLGEEPVEVSAMASALVDPAIGAAGDVDSAVVTLKTARGRLCQISCSRRATYGYDQRIEVHGSLGMLRAHNIPLTSVEKADAAGFTGEPALPFFLERYAAAYRAEIDSFVEAILTGAAMDPTGHDGLRALEIADAATESAKTGKTVSLKG
jgi:myo-inositol 2-dehydrogenase/D-chiro-inositol 1-dehydrogenase